MTRRGKSFALFKDLADLPAVVRAGQQASAPDLAPPPDNAVPGVDEPEVVTPGSADHSGNNRSVAAVSIDHSGVDSVAQQASVEKQLWLALRFYDLPLEVLSRGQSHDRAIAVVAEQQGKACVIACNQAANEQGVQAQMTLSAAYALVPGLLSLPQNEPQEQAVLKRLATWAKRFTPLVSVELPQGLLLEVKGSLALFGGLACLVQQVQKDLQALGFQHYLAAAPTPTAAVWLARHQHGQLAQTAQELNTLVGNLPVACTHWPVAVLNRLQGLGVRHLRDCMRLPRDGFARRMGRQRLLELDRALGKTPDPRDNYLPPDKFVARREFLFSIERTEMIFRGLEKLLAELVAFLRGRQAGIQTLRIRLYHQYAAASEITLGMAAVCRDAARIGALLHEKLEQLQLPAPVVAVTMVSGVLYPLSGSDGELFNDAAHHDVHWPELVEKLRARLGVRAVTGLCLVPEHRPEQAWRFAEPGTQSEVWPYNRRPLWVLSDPCRMPLRQGQPHWHGVLTRVQGPERIETGWWDGQDVARDYFVATNPKGLCLWIYRELATTPQRWYLHGIFA